MAPKKAQSVRVQQVERARGQRVAFLAPELPADVAVDVFGLEAGRIEDGARGVAALLADAVARQPCNSML